MHLAAKNTGARARPSAHGAIASGSHASIDMHPSFDQIMDIYIGFHHRVLVGRAPSASIAAFALPRRRARSSARDIAHSFAHVYK
eukprot:1674738-Pyramimonas_sp.AAC.2